MTKKEQRLSIMALGIFFLYMVPFELGPAVSGYIKQKSGNYQKLQQDIARYQHLHEQTQVWRDKHAAAQTQLAQVEAGLLQGGNRDLVAARLQNALKILAQDSAVQIRSLDLPEFSVIGQWLLVTQDIKLQADSPNLFKFLQALKKDKLFLEVVELDLRSVQNNQISGSVKVTGFGPQVGEAVTPP